MMARDSILVEELPLHNGILTACRWHRAVVETKRREWQLVLEQYVAHVELPVFAIGFQFGLLIEGRLATAQVSAGMKRRRTSIPKLG